MWRLYVRRCLQILWMTLALSSPTVDAFFRNLCLGFLATARIDPIVSPGQVAQHAHFLHGGSNLGLNSSSRDLLQSACTNCLVEQDRSAYWVPAMYFQHQNGSFTAVAAPGGLTVYYKLEKRVGALDQSYAMFPQGLRMVAGRSEKRAWNGPFPVPPRSQWSEADMTQESLAEKAIGFNCLHYDAGWNEGTFNVSYLREKAFVDAYCVDGLRAEILFPSCWDGVHLDAPDHRSHVLYPDHLESGLCPPSHPIYFPIISYEVVWGTPDFRHAAGQFVMSNGDPTGFGYHGDFMAAWEEGRLDLAAADSTCTDQDVANPATDGDVHKCSSFVVQRDEDARSCKLHVSQPVQTDPVEGLLLSLPGNVSVTGVRHDPWPR